MTNEIVRFSDRRDLIDALCEDPFHGVRLALRELCDLDAVRLHGVRRMNGSPDRRAIVEASSGVRLAVVWRRTRMAVREIPETFTSSAASVESAKPQPAPAYATRHRSYVVAPRKYPAPEWAGMNNPKDS